MDPCCSPRSSPRPGPSRRPGRARPRSRRWPRLLARPAPDEVETVTAYLGGTLRQRRTGVGWRACRLPARPADAPTLTVPRCTRRSTRIAGLAGAGSQATRAAAVADLFGRATADEQALAARRRHRRRCARVPSTRWSRRGWRRPPRCRCKAVRRAAMLAGSTVRSPAPRSRAARRRWRESGSEVGRPVLPMLASSAPDLAAAMAKAGGGAGRGRRQARRHPDPGAPLRRRRRGRHPQPRRHHRTGCPRWSTSARSLPAERRSSSTARRSHSTTPAGRGRSRRPRPAPRWRAGVVVTPYFFDLLHLDGTDLLDAPGAERSAALAALVPGEHSCRRLVTADPDAAEEFAARGARRRPRGRRGQEPRRAVRRRPARRRRGSRSSRSTPSTWSCWPSSGAAAAARAGSPTSTSAPATRRRRDGFVMLGKTFKGMTDEMLAWQTERFTELRDPARSALRRARPARAGRRDRLRRRAALDAATPAAWPSASRGSCATATTRRADEADTIETVRGFRQPRRRPTTDLARASTPYRRSSHGRATRSCISLRWAP